VTPGHFKDSYASIRNDEGWLLGCHISPYSHGTDANHDPERDRKLLLHKKEIARLGGKISEKGLTLFRSVSTSRAPAKVEIGLARGRKLHDKRARCVNVRFAGRWTRRRVPLDAARVVVYFLKIGYFKGGGDRFRRGFVRSRLRPRFPPLVNKRERYSCQHTASSGGLTPVSVRRLEPSGTGNGRHFWWLAPNLASGRGETLRLAAR